jgi:hypothetical protein
MAELGGQDMEKWFNVFKLMLANGCMPTSKLNNLLAYNAGGLHVLRLRCPKN